MGFVKPSELGGSSFFKPKSYKDAVAVLIEPKSVERDVPNFYKGNNLGNRDVITADVTVFHTADDLKGGKAEILKSIKIDKVGIVNKVSRALGGAVPGYIGMTQGKNNEYWDHLDLDPADEALLLAYYEKREAAVQAALADVPDFDA